MKKSILRVAVGLLLVLIIAAIIFRFKLNSIIKHTIETQATQSLELNTTLDSASFSIFGGQLDLHQLQVASPSGYSAPSMLSLGTGTVNIRYRQLREDPVHIPTLTLDRPTLVIEQSGGRLNFQGLVEKHLAAKPPEHPLLLIIDTLTISNASVILRPGLPGLEGKELSVPIPTLTLRNIGNADGNANGVALRQVIAQVITSLVKQSGEAGGVPAQLKTLLDDAARQVEDEVNRRVKDVTGQIDKTIKDIGSDVPKLPKDLDKVLPGGPKGK